MSRCSTRQAPCLGEGLKRFTHTQSASYFSVMLSSATLGAISETARADHCGEEHYMDNDAILTKGDALAENEDVAASPGDVKPLAVQKPAPVTSMRWLQMTAWRCQVPLACATAASAQAAVATPTRLPGMRIAQS